MIRIVFTLVLVYPLAAWAQISIAESVLTQKNNVQRTGLYDHETILTPALVASSQFGHRCIRDVDGQVVAQPLYVKGVVISGIRRNVLYVATRKNNIYAFDADNVDESDPKKGQVWANPIHLVDWDPPGSQARPLEAAPLNGMNRCNQTFGPVGITSTPVIDPIRQVMYLVARFGTSPSGPLTASGPPYHYLVSLDIRTGQELKRVLIQTPRPASPLIRGQDNARVFYPGAELNRPALLLLNNVLYIAFGAPVCDQGEDSARLHSHGWVFAYSAPGMEYLDSYNTTPGSALGGIWQSGHGLAADPARGFVYAFTGNNDLTKVTSLDLGESILKIVLGPNRKFLLGNGNGAVEHFTAGNWYRLDSGFHCPAESQGGTCPSPVPGQPALRNPLAPVRPDGDSDLGSGGPVVLSNGYVTGGGKQGRLYVLDPANAATIQRARQGFDAAFNTWHTGTTTTCKANDPRGLQCAISPLDYDLTQAWGPNIHGGPAVWERPGQPYGFLYLMGEKDYLRAYRVFPGGRLAEQAEFTSQAAGIPAGLPARAPDGMPGGAVSVSSNGNQNGIVWVSLAPQDATYSIEPGVLMAFDATNLRFLWADPDPNINYAKFVPPTIGGGKVFRAAFGRRSAGCNSTTANTSCGAVVIYSNWLTAPKLPGTVVVR